jgi:ParB family chromosome partitioning protein
MSNAIQISTEEQRLAFLQNGVRAIEEARNLEEVKQIRDQAAALRTYAKQQKASREAQNVAAEVAIRAERKAGELLKVMEKNKGGRPEETGDTVSPVNDTPPTYEDLGIHKKQASRWQKSATVPEAVFERHIQETVGKGEELTSKSVLLLAEKPHVSNNSGENEWYTPSKYIEAARQAMFGIDLDPASCAYANETVEANTYFSIEDDGLSKKWFGNVWMNPPYSQPLIKQFCQKMADSYTENDIDEACVLVNNATETGWFNVLLDIASAVCFIRGRVKFLDKQGNPSGAPLQGQAVIYIGNHPARFSDNFSEFGKVLYV